jgi:hypothetical protein
MAQDSEYFRRRAAEARAAAFAREDSDDVAVAGDLALAYAALARRQGPVPEEDAAAEATDDPSALLNE